MKQKITADVTYVKKEKENYKKNRQNKSLLG